MSVLGMVRWYVWWPKEQCFTFGVEAGACRGALDLAEHTRAMLCEAVIGERVLPDGWTEGHLPIRVITDCTSLFGCLAEDASVPEDRGTALTVASLRERCSAGVGRDDKRSGLMWVPDTSAVGRRTDEIICGCVLEKGFDIWNRSAPRGEYESLEQDTTHQQFERGSGCLSGTNGSRLVAVKT